MTATTEKPKYLKERSSDLLYLVGQRRDQVLALQTQILKDGQVRIRVELPEAFYSHIFPTRNQAREFLRYSEFQTVLLNRARQRGMEGILFDTQAYIFPTMQTSELRQLCEKMEKYIDHKWEAVWGRKESERRQKPWQSESQYQPSKAVQDLEASVKKLTDELELQKKLVEAEIGLRKTNPPTEILPSFISVLVPEPTTIVVQPKPTPGLNGEPPLTYQMRGVEYQLVQPETLEDLKRILWLTQKMQDSNSQLHRAAVEIITNCLEEQEHCQVITLADVGRQVVIWQESVGREYGQYNLLNSYDEFERKLAENTRLLAEVDAHWKETAASWLAKTGQN